MMTGTTASFTIDDAGQSITVASVANRLQAAVSINRLFAGEDRTVQIGNLDLQPNDTVSLTFQPALSPTEQERIVLQTANNADQNLSLSVRRSGESTEASSGYAALGADNLALPSNAALAVQIDEWTNLAQATVVTTDATGAPGAPTSLTNVAAPTAMTLEPTQYTLHRKGDQLVLPLTVRDQFGAYVADGAAVVISTTLGSLSAREVTTANGRATTTLTHGGEPGEALITARSGDAQAIVTILLKAPTGLPDDEEPAPDSTYQIFLPVIQR
jgi:hypothetical protein